VATPTLRPGPTQQANSAHACFGDEFIEEAVQISRLDHRADRRGKDQAGIDPGRSKRKGFGSLICAVGSEHLRRGRRKRNCATRLVRLWRTEHKAHLGQPLHVLPDVEHTTFEVDVVPTEGEQLAFP